MRLPWGELSIVENVEAEVCTECGARYFHATTLDELDRYLLWGTPRQKRLHVEIVSQGKSPTF